MKNNTKKYITSKLKPNGVRGYVLCVPTKDGLEIETEMARIEQYNRTQGSIIYDIFVSKELAGLIQEAGYPQDIFVDLAHNAWRSAVGNNPSDNDTDATREVLAKFAHGKGSGSISNYPISKRLEREIAGEVFVEHIGIVC